MFVARIWACRFGESAGAFLLLTFLNLLFNREKMGHPALAV